MPTPTTPDPPRWYLDTVVLSNFALAGRVGLLARRYGKRGQVPQEVLGEISDGIVAGYAALRAIEDAVAEASLTAAEALSAGERRDYRGLLSALSPGEASCIVCAGSRGGTVATDDRAARACGADCGIPFTGTIGILRASCMDEALSPSEADAAPAAMVRAGLYSPVQRVSDLL